METSAFSSEFIALKTCIETIRGLRYNLRMFGIPLQDNDPAHIFCDNESVVKNCSHKKHSSIAYHMSRWAVTSGEVSVGWINSAFNLADAFTKRLSKQVRENLFWCWTY